MTLTPVLGIEARPNYPVVVGPKTLWAALAYFGLVLPSGAIEYTVTDLGTLPGGSYSAGLSINNSGQVVGFSNFSGSGNQAIPTVWNGSIPTALGALPAVTAGQAKSINDSG